MWGHTICGAAVVVVPGVGTGRLEPRALEDANRAKTVRAEDAIQGNGVGNLPGRRLDERENWSAQTTIHLDNLPPERSGHRIHACDALADLRMTVGDFWRRGLPACKDRCCGRDGEKNV